jgi:hypothetical protein
MSADKLITIYGVTGKLESSYAGGGTPSTSTDGILCAELPKLSLAYANDGSRAMPPGTAGFQKRVAPSARTGEATIKMEPRGAGAAYGASVLPGVHTLMRVAGFDAAIVTTGGIEKVTYTPTPGPGSFASGAFWFYERGQLYPVSALYSDFELAFDGPSVPLMSFATKGIVLAAITDVAVPAITYGDAAILPPKAVGIAFAHGAVTGLRVRGASFKLGREISPRLDVNASGGHAGFSIGRRAPTLEVTIETPLIATIDPHVLWAAGSTAALTMTIGATQYNRYKLTAPAGQIVGVEELEDGPTALTKLTYQLNPSASNLNDEVAVVFD